jgi:5-oxoprolinase (ATP-hydrolysing) subunit A
MPSSPDRTIDLNADVGEGAGEEPLYEWISSANVACGGHAGDAASMREAVRLALRHGVAVGAHPSYDDRRRFGRTSIDLDPAELARSIEAQLAAFRRIADELGAPVRHVKPHGALYNDAAYRAEVALAVALGAASLSPVPILVGLSGSPALRIWRERSFRVAAEGFADRAYEPDGTLVPRSVPGALVCDPSMAATQAVRLAEQGRCATICLHSDTPGAATIAKAARTALERAGFTIRAIPDEDE